MTVFANVTEIKLKSNQHRISLVPIKLENMAIAMHCNLRPADAAGVQKRHIVFKRREPICTKFGEDIVRSSIQTKCKNGADISLRFEKAAAQSCDSLSDKAKISLFDHL